MQGNRTMPPVDPASEIALHAVHDAFEGLTRLIDRERKPELRQKYERAREVLASIFSEENGAPRGTVPNPSRRALAPVGGNPPAVQSESEGFEPPMGFPTPDFESGSSSSEGNGSEEEPDDDEEPGARGFSPRARQLAALAWDLVERDPKLAARVAFDLVELVEHDPLACAAPCCNSPLPIGVRP